MKIEKLSLISFSFMGMNGGLSVVLQAATRGPQRHVRSEFLNDAQNQRSGLTLVKIILGSLFHISTRFEISITHKSSCSLYHVSIM